MTIMVVGKKVTSSIEPHDVHLVGKKSFYLFTKITGGIFFGIGLFTLFNMANSLLVFSSPSNGTMSTLILRLSAVFPAALSFFVFYGFMNRRKWVLSLTNISIFFELFMYMLRHVYTPYPNNITIIPIAIFVVLSTILFLNRDALGGILIDKKIIIPFSIIFLITVSFFWIINFN